MRRRPAQTSEVWKTSEVWAAGTAIASSISGRCGIANPRKGSIMGSERKADGVAPDERRRFLKSAGALGAGLALGAPAGAAPKGAGAAAPQSGHRADGADEISRRPFGRTN